MGAEDLPGRIKDPRQGKKVKGKPGIRIVASS